MQVFIQERATTGEDVHKYGHTFFTLRMFAGLGSVLGSEEQLSLANKCSANSSRCSPPTCARQPQRARQPHCRSNAPRPNNKAHTSSIHRRDPRRMLLPAGLTGEWCATGLKNENNFKTKSCWWESPPKYRLIAHTQPNCAALQLMSTRCICKQKWDKNNDLK